MLTFESHAAGLNGSCLLAPGVILIADCAAGLIWRVDLSEDGLAGTAKVWLRHESMTPGTDPEQAVHLTQTFSIPYPGVNGVRAAEPGRDRQARLGGADRILSVVMVTTPRRPGCRGIGC